MVNNTHALIGQKQNKLQRMVIVELIIFSTKSICRGYLLLNIIRKLEPTSIAQEGFSKENLQKMLAKAYDIQRPWM